MTTAAAVSGGGARGRRPDWRAWRQSSAGSANNGGNNGNNGDECDNGDEGDTWVVVQMACCRPPPPARPPSDSNGDGGGYQRGWREGVSLRLACAASELSLPHHQDDKDSENDSDVVM